VIVHALPEPEQLVNLAGMRSVGRTVLELSDGTPTGTAHARVERELRIDPDEVRRLGVGECFVIQGGRAERLLVIPVPTSGRRRRRVAHLRPVVSEPPESRAERPAPAEPTEAADPLEGAKAPGPPGPMRPYPDR
jgi:hypothetical protein